MKVSLGEVRGLVRGILLEASSLRPLVAAVLSGDRDAYAVLRDAIEERFGPPEENESFYSKLFKVLAIGGVLAHHRDFGGVDTAGFPGVFTHMLWQDDWFRIGFPDGAEVAFDPERPRTGQVRVTSPLMKDVDMILKNSEDVDVPGEAERLSVRFDRQRIILFVSQDGDPGSVRYARWSAGSDSEERIPTEPFVRRAVTAAEEYGRLLRRAIDFFESVKRGIGG